ncbi:MAG: polysaccharide lyase family protein [Chitinophagaceae bacterium]
MKNFVRVSTFLPSSSRFNRILPFLLFSFLLSNRSFSQQWNILGNESQISAVASSYTTIVVVDDMPFVAYVEGASSGPGKVKKRNAGTGNWDQVGGNIGTTVSFTRIYADKNNKLYVTYVDVANGSKLAVVTYNTSTLTWEPLSVGNLYVSTGTVTYSISQFSATPRSSIAFDGNNIPYIAYSERSSGSPYVKNFVGGTWQILGAGAISADIAAGNNIALDNDDIPYLVYLQQSTATATTGVVKTFRYNLTTLLWEDISPVSPVAPGSATTGATTGARHTSITIDSSGNPMVSYFNTSNSNKSTILRFNKTSAAWSYIGTTSTRDAPNNSLVNDNGGNVYNMFSDALSNGGLAAMIRVFKLSNGSAAFNELKNPTYSRGIDSTGDNSTTARSISLGDLSIAVGSDTSKPFIVYTKTNSGSLRTPIVQRFSQGLVTTPVINITGSTASSGGIISSDGGSAITERGIVYGTTIYPTTANNKVIDATGGTGTFTSSLTSLAGATTYHVRAYAINGSGTVYGNNLTFSTPPPDPNSVTVQDNGGTVILNNGIVKATITKANATVTSMVYNGMELITGGYNGGQLYWSWNMPNYQNPSGCTYTLTTDPHSNNFDYAEIKLHMVWNASASTAAMDVDVYYSLPKNASGLYASATLSHPAAYPALPGGEWRMAGYPHPRFDWLSVDSLRNKTMPSAYDMQNTATVPGAPVEVSRITTGAYTNYYECKYDYSADFGDIDTWGWSSTTDNVGLWITAPSKEYYPGGPKKRELLVHGTPVILNMLGGTHYSGGDETSVAAGEDWKKTYGPFLIYCNKVAPATPNAPIVLWNDAKAQALTEQAAWPYSWYTNPDYVKDNGRGTVTGKLVINEAGSPSASNMWVGLAIPPVGASNPNEFQHWSKNYQFWVKTDAAGNFSIPNVLPGTYNFYAFGPGAAGQLSLTNFASVTATNTTALGDVSWTPTRTAPTVWEIGTPDRTAMEYKHGTDWWKGGYYPNPHWAKFMDYGDEFPTDVNFTIGQSNIATDWNFVQPYDKGVQATSPKWNVNFNLTTDPASGSIASVYVALAANFTAALILTVNGTNVTSPSTGIVPGSSTNAMIRKGIHGAFADVRFNFPASMLHAGSNQISFTLRITGGGNSGEVMYDYLRLEASGTSIPLPVTISTIKAYQQQQDIQVEWTALTETDIDRYDIEKSTDGNHFLKQGSVHANGTNAALINYQWLDVTPNKGNNYYRIKAVSKDNDMQYSKVVKVSLSGSAGSILVYPNQVNGSLVNLQLNNLQKGVYQLKLYNISGQQLMAKPIAHNGGSSVQTIELNPGLPAGIYQLELCGHGQSFIQKLIKD